MAGPLVSVIVLNYNGAVWLRDCLGSLLRQSYPDLEIMVADNRSTDDSRTIAESFGVNFVSMNHNLGFSRTNNAVARVSRGKLLFFVNNDMKFDHACISELALEMERSRQIFASDPMQFDWNGSRIIHAVTSIKRGGIRSWFPFLDVKYSGGELRHTFVPWGCAGSLMVRRELFFELGGFDETFFIDMEDLDICVRAWMNGWKTSFVPSARVYHWVGESQSVVGPGEQWRWSSSETNLLRFILKTMDTSAVAKLLAAKVLQSLTIQLDKNKRRRMIIWKALYKNLLMLPDTLRKRSILMNSSTVSGNDLLKVFIS